ncbi:hypothetical protein CVCC1112_2590 [Paenarthrobacter nicotinovorans]|uniref:UvrD-helicase domain-containing protein n=1 Tax=Paenarthrobacter nicotinovorans TaxID=29320 RepID=UPI0007CCF955|nr:UvrD-helicase domain-containing protein [Paenarthrobacter nicotinovorans]GAT87931.1 hypothetical protein CVCC1112_2590 [Paenarthrobacter nicotinovorans]
MTGNDAARMLTEEQLVAAASREKKIYIQASPGSGKTTVAVQRFGFLRFGSRANLVESGRDARPVVALSFTRSATRELRQRIRDTWGQAALAWPHRVATIDTLVFDLLSHLLRHELLTWPSGCKDLEIHDSWKALVRHAYARVEVAVVLNGRAVEIVRTFASVSKVRPEPIPFSETIARGICTHEDIRRVLEMALEDPELTEQVRMRLRQTMRALIVDEVFDGNALDVKLIELAEAAGIEVTLVGDPWQALYDFRGARPDLVDGLVKRKSFRELPLEKSFRWQSKSQLELASALRDGVGFQVSEYYMGISDGPLPDVVLCSKWKPLWAVDDSVLPLAFGAAKGNLVEAASTLLLDCFLRSRFHLSATYLADALATLGVTDQSALGRMEPMLSEVIARLGSSESSKALKEVYSALIGVVGSESGREFPKVHHNYTKRLDSLRRRIVHQGKLTPGVTIHQSKGREWDVVALQLDAEEAAHLRRGLDYANEDHRRLYVACTRARYRTVVLA